jgi:hypothetical protein
LGVVRPLLVGAPSTFGFFAASVQALFFMKGD